MSGCRSSNDFIDPAKFLDVERAIMDAFALSLAGPSTTGGQADKQRHAHPSAADRALAVAAASNNPPPEVRPTNRMQQSIAADLEQQPQAILQQAAGIMSEIEMAANQ